MSRVASSMHRCSCGCPSPAPKAGACPQKRGPPRGPVWTLSTSRTPTMTLKAGNAKIVPVALIVWDPSSGPTWWPNSGFGACPDPPRNSSEPACYPRRVSVRPIPISTTDTTTASGRRPRIWRGFNGGTQVGNQKHVTRSGDSNRNARAAVQAAARTTRPPLAASAAVAARASSAKGWPVAPCAQKRAPIERCWPSAFLPFCWGQQPWSTCRFERRVVSSR